MMHLIATATVASLTILAIARRYVMQGVLVLYAVNVPR